MEIDSINDLKNVLRNGPYAWPGGYPMYFITKDNSVLSFAAVYKEIRQVFKAMKYKGSDIWWEIDSVCINYEETDMYCEHTGIQIPCAYSE